MRIGLTGGIGSGKSTVAALLAQQGAAVIDADMISRRLTARGGAAMPALLRAFGQAVASADGSLDRDAMRLRLLSDADAKQHLEAVLHPLIGAEALRQAEAANSPMVVFDVPLLAESPDWRERVQRVLVVDCSEATQLERVSKRAGWSADSARRVIELQASRAVRRAIADAVIFNDGMTLAALGDAVTALCRIWQLPA